MAILRKAQVETFGLLVIVILIVFIAVFILRLSLLSSQPDTSIKDSIIANNVITAITKVTICQKQQLPAILRSCQNSGKICNQDSCQLLANELSIMLLAAGFKQEEYKLEATVRDKKLVDIGSCNIIVGNVIASSPYTIYLEGNSAILKMYICR